MALTLYVTHWDVVENKEGEYEQFILKTYIPACKQIGLRMLGGYYMVEDHGSSAYRRPRALLNCNGRSHQTNTGL